jgi:hypothetical protein
MQKVYAIQEASASMAKRDEDRSSFRVARMVHGHIAKRRRMDVVIVPEVHTFRAVEVSGKFSRDAACRGRRYAEQQ